MLEGSDVPQMFCRAIRALLLAAIFGSDGGMVSTSENNYPLSQPSSNLGTRDMRSLVELVAHDAPPSTSSPSPALALPFFLRLALKTDLRRLTLPLPLPP